MFEYRPDVKLGVSLDTDGRVRVPAPLTPEVMLRQYKSAWWPPYVRVPLHRFDLSLPTDTFEQVGWRRTKHHAEAGTVVLMGDGEVQLRAINIDDARLQAGLRLSAADVSFGDAPGDPPPETTLRGVLWGLVQRHDGASFRLELPFEGVTRRTWSVKRPWVEHAHVPDFASMALLAWLACPGPMYSPDVKRMSAKLPPITLFGEGRSAIDWALLRRMVVSLALGGLVERPALLTMAHLPTGALRRMAALAWPILGHAGTGDASSPGLAMPCIIGAGDGGSPDKSRQVAPVAIHAARAALATLAGVAWGRVHHPGHTVPWAHLVTRWRDVVAQEKGGVLWHTEYSEVVATADGKFRPTQTMGLPFGHGGPSAMSEGAARGRHDGAGLGPLYGVAALGAACAVVLPLDLTTVAVVMRGREGRAQVHTYAGKNALLEAMNILGCEL